MRTEHQIISRLHGLFKAQKGRMGIGDDAAVTENGTLISTDAVSEGVHFVRSDASWGEVAYKLFASNGSDMAAMGGQAEAYTLSLGMPFDWTDDALDSFIAGVEEYLRDFPADLLGGDLVRSPAFFGSVTVLGKAFQKPWLRSGAKEGSFVYVTGTLGDSRLYLHKILGQQKLHLADEAYFRRRHYRPSPRSAWAEQIGKGMGVEAAMDISDGLAEDLAKLCAASGVSFHLDGEKLPLSRPQIGAKNLALDEGAYLREALTGGEDYELIIISPDEAPSHLPLTKVGRIGAKGANGVSFFGTAYGAEEFKGYSH